MTTHTRKLRSLNLDTGAHRRRVGECQPGAVCLGGAAGANHALKTAYWTLAVVLALSSSWVHAQTPTCVAPGCNSVVSDSKDNTAMGRAALTQVDTNPDFYFGTDNTASGFGALEANTTGAHNTASGAFALNHNTTGVENTASGVNALYSNTTGILNTASGVSALYSNTIGADNTAWGAGALYGNTTGNFNAASGTGALSGNTTGDSNTASGASALIRNTTGNDNTASGANALFSNTIGSYNTASGMNALYYNTTGSNNIASGTNALLSNTTGNENTASGVQALNFNLSGHHNTAAGFKAIFNNRTGNSNTGVGYFALFSNTIGLNNIGIGNNAGYAVTGSNNIDIGSMGSAGESGVIRIGGPSQTAAYMAGISSTHLTGSPVYVNANGQLGVLSSSERYKTEITSMGGSTEKLHELRPVSFHLKSDPKGAVQYGLIAEEVAKVFPELVIRDEAGTIQGVRYDELAPMLLNEVQQQAAEIRDLKQQVAELNSLKQEMRAALDTLKSKDQLVAQR